jgi:ribosomal protein S18 acetylase RimI-like enzyme
MKNEDRPAILQILHNTPEFRPDEIVVAEEVLNDYLQDGIRSGYHVLVAEGDSSILGYICFGQTPLTEATWDIYWIVTSRDYQQKGVGKTLLKFAEEKIKQAGGKIVVVETSSRPEYEKARRLYRSLEYRLTCRLVDFYAAGDDKLVFVKRLG